MPERRTENLFPEGVAAVKYDELIAGFRAEDTPEARKAILLQLADRIRKEYGVDTQTKPPADNITAGRVEPSPIRPTEAPAKPETKEVVESVNWGEKMQKVYDRLINLGGAPNDRILEAIKNGVLPNSDYRILDAFCGMAHRIKFDRSTKPAEVEKLCDQIDEIIGPQRRTIRAQELLNNPQSRYELEDDVPDSVCSFQIIKIGFGLEYNGTFMVNFAPWVIRRGFC